MISMSSGRPGASGPVPVAGDAEGCSLSLGVIVRLAPVYSANGPEVGAPGRGLNAGASRVAALRPGHRRAIQFLHPCLDRFGGVISVDQIAIFINESNVYKR
jgi:hypothetical protein